MLDAALDAGVPERDAVIVAAGEGWHRGVIGIVASRLVDRTGRPALVASIEGDTAFGSARSVPGFDVVEALTAAAHLLDEFGGHHQAAGFRLPAARLGDLRAALLAHAEGLDPRLLEDRIHCDDILRPGSVTASLALELERLAPFGVGNPRPRFLCPGYTLARPPQLLKQEHVKLILRGDEGEIEAVGWRRGELAEALVGVDEVSMVATLRVRRWGGRVTPQLEIEDLCA